MSPELTSRVAVEFPSLNWNVLADRDAVGEESDADDQLPTPVAPKPALKSAADPVLELTKASRVPFASVTMLAFTPIPDVLIAVARSESEFTPDPALNDFCDPSDEVMVRVDVPRLELLLGKDGEYHAALVARLCTEIKCVPTLAPDAAVPET